MESIRSISSVLKAAIAALAICSIASACGGRNSRPEPTATSAAVLPSSAPAPEPASEPASEPAAAIEPSAPAAVLALAKKAESLGDEAALADFESGLAALSPAELDAVEAMLETAVAEAELAKRPAPSLRLALSACYGRKGLSGKAYAAVLSAEKEAKAPGVSFGLAVIYGRKALLAPAVDEKPCTLVVESVPTGATIIVDGVAAGAAPARLEAVRPGRHELRAVLAGYDEYVGIVEAGPGVVIAGKAILVPARVPCRVDAEPEGAELWIDGSLVGKTPWNGALRPGRYSMEARMEGYEPAAETVSVAFASAMGTSLRLSPRPAVLVVESEPLGALVDLNGEQLGRTPLRIETKAFEARYVSLRPPDFIYAASDPVPIELRPGEESKVSLRFAKKSAPLGFKPSVGLPAGAVVLVDGERFDTVPTGDKALEFGAHDIEIRADGYDAISQSVSWDGLWGRRLAMTRRLPKVAVDGIKVDGAIADWAGIAPIFIDPAGDDKSPKVSGTDLVAVYAASDGLYLYVRMDFADGVFRANGSDWREQCLKIHGDRDGSSQYFIYLSLIAEGTTLEPRIRVNKAGPSGEPNVKKVTSGCSFRNGDGLVEMRFPLSAFSAYVKNGDVFNFWSHVGPDYPKGTDETERIDVRIR